MTPQTLWRTLLLVLGWLVLVPSGLCTLWFGGAALTPDSGMSVIVPVVLGGPVIALGLVFRHIAITRSVGGREPDWLTVLLAVIFLGAVIVLLVPALIDLLYRARLFRM